MRGLEPLRAGRTAPIGFRWALEGPDVREAASVIGEHAASAGVESLTISSLGRESVGAARDQLAGRIHRRFAKT